MRKNPISGTQFCFQRNGTEQHIQHLIRVIRQHSNALILVDAA